MSKFMRRIQPKRPDWGACIRALEKREMTQAEIAMRIGVATSTVNRLKNDPMYNPRWETGEAVLMCFGELSDDPR